MGGIFLESVVGDGDVLDFLITSLSPVPLGNCCQSTEYKVLELCVGVVGLSLCKYDTVVQLAGVAVHLLLLQVEPKHL